jgi:tRNA A-37 threonylcarbamoyl transferase component Bud32
LNRLLAQALDLDPPQRTGWLEALPPESQHLKPLLERLLATELSDATSETLKPVVQIAAQAVATAMRRDSSGERIGPWQLERLLAEGGMGAVWLAQRADGVMQRSAALKLPRAEWVDQGLNERIARERDILARLQHPHIAVLYDAGLGADGRPYLALEYVDGRPIDEWCKGRELRTVVALFVHVVRAVAHAHAQLVIHRDLKPSNVLVTADGVPKLLDFGISKLLQGDAPLAEETALTRLTGRALTLAYAAPEQVLGLPVAVTADVYALGVLLFELLAQARLYRAADARALEAELLGGDLRKPSDAAADRDRARRLRGDLDAIVQTALKREPALRYPTAEALADDLERWLAGEPVRARPDSRGYRLRKFVTRNRLAVAAGSVVVVALTVGLGIALWQAETARTQAQRATALNTFVLSLIRQADPNASRQTKEADVALLTAIEERIDKEFTGSPDQLLQLRVTVADAYRNRGEMMAARRVYQRAIDEATPKLPADDLMLLTARVRVADPQIVVSTAVAAQLGPVIDRLRNKGGAGAELLIDALLIRHELESEYGVPEVPMPERHFEPVREAHRIALAHFGEGSRQHLRVLRQANGVTSAMETRGEDSSQLLAAALAKARQHNDGTVESLDYRLADAVRAGELCNDEKTAVDGFVLLERQMAEVRAAHGPNSAALESLLTLALRCRVPDSAPLLQKRLPTGADVFEVAAAREKAPSMSRLRAAMEAYDLAVSGRDEADAERFYQHIVENMAAIPEPALRERLTWLSRSARMCQLARRGDAEEVHRLGAAMKPALAELFARVGNITRGEHVFWVCLSDAERQLERYADAEAAARTLIDKCRANEALHPSWRWGCTERALSALVMVYLDAGLLDKARAAMAERLATDPQGKEDPRFAIARSRLLIADGQAAQAVPVLREVLDGWLSGLPSLTIVAEHRYWLGRALAASGDPSGRAMVEQARRALAASPLKTHQRLAAADPTP